MKAARALLLTVSMLIGRGLGFAASPNQRPATVRAAAVQFVSRWAKPAENRQAIEPLVREAARNGAKIVVLPEAAITGYMSHDINFEPPKLKQNHVDHLLYSIAWVDDANSDWFTKRLPEIARKTGVNIIGANWSVPDQPGWHGYGQSLILLRTGETAARVKSDFGNEIIYADLPVPEKRQGAGHG